MAVTPSALFVLGSPSTRFHRRPSQNSSHVPQKSKGRSKPTQICRGEEESNPIAQKLREELDYYDPLHSGSAQRFPAMFSLPNHTYSQGSSIGLSVGQRQCSIGLMNLRLWPCSPAIPSLSRKQFSSLPFYRTPPNERPYFPSVVAFSVQPPAIRSPALFCRRKIIDSNLVCSTSCAIHSTDSLDWKSMVLPQKLYPNLKKLFPV